MLPSAVVQYCIQQDRLLTALLLLLPLQPLQMSPRKNIETMPATRKLSEVQASQSTCINKLKQQMSDAQAAYCSGHTAAHKVCDYPYKPDSHEHVAALVCTLSNQADARCMYPTKAAVADFPVQRSTTAHVAELVNSFVSRASSEHTHTATHTPVLAELSCLASSKKSYVAQLASQLSSQLQGDSSSHSSSLPSDSPYQPDSKSHVSDLVNTYKRAVDTSSSPAPVNPMQAEAARKLPQAVMPKDSHKPRIVGPDEVFQAPDIIHISYGRKAPYKTSTSQIVRLAAKFAATKADEEELVKDDAQPAVQQCSQPCQMEQAAVSALEIHPDGGCHQAGSCIQPARAMVPAPPPSTPNNLNQRAKAPRHKPQVAAARVSSNNVEGAKARLSSSAACECSGVKVANKASSDHRVTVAAASEDNGSSDGSNSNPLYVPQLASSAGFLAENSK